MPDWTLSTLLQQGGLSNSIRALSRFGPGAEADQQLEKEYRGITDNTIAALTGLAAAALAAGAALEGYAPGTSIPFNSVPESPIDEQNTVTMNIVATVPLRGTNQTMRRPIVARIPTDNPPADLDAYLRKLIRDYFKQLYPNAKIGKVTDESYRIYSATRGPIT